MQTLRPWLKEQLGGDWKGVADLSALSPYTAGTGEIRSTLGAQTALSKAARVDR